MSENNQNPHSLNGQDDSMKLEQSECSICLEPMNVQTSERLCTPCGHQFHARCLLQSLVYRMFCPFCRTTLSEDWLFANRLVIRLSREDYWSNVDQDFGRPIGEGPLIPSQQRVRDAELYRRFGTPEIWDPTWIEDRLAETRMRFNIPPDIVLYVSDLQKIEELGRRGITPEWNVSNWIWS